MLQSAQMTVYEIKARPSGFLDTLVKTMWPPYMVHLFRFCFYQAAIVNYSQKAHDHHCDFADGHLPELLNELRTAYTLQQGNPIMVD